MQSEAVKPTEIYLEKTVLKQSLPPETWKNKESHTKYLNIYIWSKEIEWLPRPSEQKNVKANLIQVSFIG